MRWQDSGSGLLPPRDWLGAGARAGLPSLPDGSGLSGLTGGLEAVGRSGTVEAATQGPPHRCWSQLLPRFRDVREGVAPGGP